MWPFVVALLLASLRYGSAQIIFRNIKSVQFNVCNKTILIPCYVTNIESTNINELYLVWKFKEINILIFDGALNKSITNEKFSTAAIDSLEFLKGNASLKLDKKEAKVGNYTCEVTELIREGLITVELKYRKASWFSLSENIFIIIFPLLAILLFWAQFGILFQKYKSNPMNKKMIFLTAAGLLLTGVVISGVILFIPGNYSKRKSYGLILFVSPLVMLIFLHYFKFKPAIGTTVHVMNILPIIQALGFILALAGLYLTVNACVPKYGPLLISGLGIITLVELFGFIYMKWLDPLIGLL